MKQRDSVVAIGDMMAEAAVNLSPEGQWAFWSLRALHARTAGIETAGHVKDANRYRRAYMEVVR